MSFCSYIKVSEVIVIVRHAVSHNFLEAEKLVYKFHERGVTRDFLSGFGKIRKAVIDNSLLEIGHFKPEYFSSLGRSMNLQFFIKIGMHKKTSFSKRIKM